MRAGISPERVARFAGLLILESVAHRYVSLGKPRTRVRGGSGLRVLMVARPPRVLLPVHGCRHHCQLIATRHLTVADEAGSLGAPDIAMSQARQNPRWQFCFSRIPDLVRPESAPRYSRLAQPPASRVLRRGCCRTTTRCVRSCLRSTPIIVGVQVPGNIDEFEHPHAEKPSGGRFRGLAPLYTGRARTRRRRARIVRRHARALFPALAAGTYDVPLYGCYAWQCNALRSAGADKERGGEHGYPLHNKGCRNARSVPCLHGCMQ